MWHIMSDLKNKSSNLFIPWLLILMLMLLMLLTLLLVDLLSSVVCFLLVLDYACLPLRYSATVLFSLLTNVVDIKFVCYDLHTHFSILVMWLLFFSWWCYCRCWCFVLIIVVFVVVVVLVVDVVLLFCVVVLVVVIVLVVVLVLLFLLLLWRNRTATPPSPTQKRTKLETHTSCTYKPCQWGVTCFKLRLDSHCRGLRGGRGCGQKHSPLEIPQSSSLSIKYQVAVWSK